MAYKPVPKCPEDGTRQHGMVQSTSTEETYHCPNCGTYWHYAYVKHYGIGNSRYKWRLLYVRDDFGKMFEMIYPS